MAGLDSRSSTLSESGTGSFSWARIQRLFDEDALVHWQRCAAQGLQCPQEVFTHLFQEQENDDFLVTVRAVDWGRVAWELREFSGVALRHVRVNQERQSALDEARDRTTRFGIIDNRDEVFTHWRDAKTWLVPPIVVSGDLVGGGAGFELLVGNTRLGNLLGLLDLEEVSEVQMHLVWMGKRLERK
jgi:hypothetical protein